MPSAFELQLSTQTFTDQVKQSLLATPRPLPPANFGMQLQRVRYREVSLRNTKPMRWYVAISAIGGLPIDKFDSKQLQLAIDITVEIAAQARIEAAPNQLVTPDLALDATLVLDLDVTQPALGVLALEATFTDLEVGVAFPSLAGIADPKQWAMDEIKKLLVIDPVKFDLSDLLAHGQQFENSGVTVDTTGQALVIRAETFKPDSAARWHSFYDGVVTPRLNGDGWSVVIDPRDLTLMIDTAVRTQLRRAVGPDRLFNVEVYYAAAGDRAVFTIITDLRVWEFGLALITDGHARLPITVSVGIEDGQLVVDLNGSALEVAADALYALGSALAMVLVPVFGGFAAFALQGLFEQLVDDASHAGAEEIGGFGELPAGSTVEELGTFVYRLRIPFAAPAQLPGAITTFDASAGAVTIGGDWNVSRLTEGELVVDGSSRFARTVPWIACGAAGSFALNAFDLYPGNNTVVHAESNLSTTGTAPVSVDAVITVDAPAPETGLTVAPGGPRLPSKIALDGPNGMPFHGPALLDVRTSIGVLRLSFEPVPGGVIGEQELRFLRSQIVMNLTACDAESLPVGWIRKHFGGLFGGHDLTSAELMAVLQEQTVDTLPAFYHAFDPTGTGPTGIHIDTSGLGTSPV
ncbi:MAG: hypothetical protein PGN13_11435 [Patulibacter minatonensis]